MAGRERSSSQIVDEILAIHAGRPGALLPILHDLQHAAGVVSDAAVAQIALALNLSRADVHGVVTFYHDFRREPAGRTVVKLCQAEACQARGSRAITAHAEACLGISMGQTTANGAVTLEPIYCLGLCASGPSGLINDQPVARLDEMRLERLLDQVAP